MPAAHFAPRVASLVCGFLAMVACAGTGERAITRAEADAGAEAGADADAAADADAVADADAPLSDLSVPSGACLPRPPRNPPVVHVGPTRVGYPSDLVVHFVRKGARPSVEACVREARLRVPSLEGRLVLHFELPKTGGIAGARISRGVGDASLHECVARVVERAPMPALREGGTTTVDNFTIAVCPDGHTEWPHEGGFR